MEEENSDSSNSEGVLSDVHVHPIKPPKLGNSNFISRYPILSHDLPSQTDSNNTFEMDGEGDFVVPRRKKKPNGME